MQQSMAEVLRALEKLDRGLAMQRETHAEILQVQDAQPEILTGFMARTEDRFEQIVSVVGDIDDWRESVEDRLSAVERKLAG